MRRVPPAVPHRWVDSIVSGLGRCEPSSAPLVASPPALPPCPEAVAACTSRGRVGPRWLGDTGLDAFCCGGGEESSVFVRRVFWPRPVKDRWPPVVRCSSAATVAPQLVAAGEVVRAAVGCRGRGPPGLWLRFALPGSGTWDAGTSQEGGRSVGWCRALEYGRQVRSLDSCAGASRATLGSRDSASLPTARCGCGRSIRGGLVLSPGVRGQSGRGSSGDLRGLPSCCRGCGGHRPPWGQCFWRVNSFSQPRGVTAPQTQSLPCCPFSPRCRGVGVCSSEAGMSFTPRRTQLLSRDALWWTTSGTGRLCSRSCPRMLAHGRAWPASREARPVLRACGLPGRGAALGPSR